MFALASSKDHFKVLIIQPQPRQHVIYSLEFDYSPWNFKVFRLFLDVYIPYIAMGCPQFLKNIFMHTLPWLRLIDHIREMVYISPCWSVATINYFIVCTFENKHMWWMQTADNWLKFLLRWGRWTLFSSVLKMMVLRMGYHVHSEIEE